MFIFNKMMYEKIPVCREFKHTQSKKEKTERKKEKAKSYKIPVTLGKNELLRSFMSKWIPVMLQCRFRLLFHVVQRWDFTKLPFHDICSYDTVSKKSRFI